MRSGLYSRNARFQYLRSKNVSHAVVIFISRNPSTNLCRCLWRLTVSYNVFSDGSVSSDARHACSVAVIVVFTVVNGTQVEHHDP